MSPLWWAVPAALAVLYAAAAALRLRRALHVFQLEGYKHGPFRRYRAPTLWRRLYLAGTEGKKPLVMTGRATRLLATGLALVVVPAWVAVGLVSGLAGSPGWAVVAVAGAGVLTAWPGVLHEALIAADRLLAPWQRRINDRFLRAATATLTEVAPVVVGITGSFGKTSTKFAVAGLIGSPEEVLATPGSFNTPLGVCRTINEELRPDHRYFVVEMGAYREGDVAELCAFVRPRVGVLTAIGPMHLERFGSMDAIRRAKYEIVTSLPEGGTAVMNVDDAEVRVLADRTEGLEVVRYGLEPAGRPDVTARDVRIIPEGMALTIVDRRSGDSIEATTRLLGRHAAGHVLAGAAVALSVGRPLVDLAPAISLLEPVEHRLQLIRGAGGVTVIDDAYNSNPQGAEAALEVLAGIPAGKRVLVTPGIVELGDLQDGANRAFGKRAAEVADVVILVGRLNRAALTEGTAGGRAEVLVADSLTEATAKLSGLLGAGDVVLFENDLPDHYEG